MFPWWTSLGRKIWATWHGSGSSVWRRPTWNERFPGQFGCSANIGGSILFFWLVLTLWFLTVLLIFGIPWKGWRDQVDQVCCKSVGSSSHRKKTVRIWTDSSFLPTTFNFWTDKSVPLGRPLRRYQARAWARALPETFAWNDIRSVVSTGGRADAAAALKAAEEARDAEQKARRKCPLMSATFWEHRIVVQTWVKLESTFQAWAAARAAETAAQRLAGTLLYGFGASGCAVRPQVAHLSRWPRLIRHLIWEWWAAQLFYWSCIRKLAMVQYSVMCESVWCWNV